MTDAEYVNAGIMIVEDEALIADDIAETLMQMGYRITSVLSSGEEAVNRAREERPDLVIMDIMLRDKMDGIETAGQLRSELKIPVIYLTAYADDEILERAKITEPYAYIIKPFEERELHISISIALYKARMEKKMQHMEEEANRARKMETAAILAGGMAHDFNNLMAIILGNIQLAKEDSFSKEDLHDYLQAAENAVLEARELTRKYIHLSMPRTLYRLPVKLDKVLENAVSEFRFNASIQYSVEVQKPSPYVYADENMLHRAICHIIENAADAMPEGGTLRITAEKGNIRHRDMLLQHHPETADYAEICIKDSGSGIAEEHLTKVFDPYYSTKERYSRKGMGLGLSIAYSIIRSHGGYIRIESESGKGTSLFVYFPLVSEPLPSFP